MNTSQQSPRSIARMVLGPVLGGIVLGLVVACASIVFEADLVRAFIGGDPVSADTTTVDLADVLMGQCWTLTEGEIPGHVVYDMGGVPDLGGVRMVGLALEQLPTSMGGLGADHGMTVHGFCK